jgi:aminoglycoside phosphotransferase
MVVVVSLAVEFSDGHAVDDLEPAPAGLAHRVFFGVEAGSGSPVVVKIEQIPGRLEIEHQALSWLSQMEVDVPRVHWFGSGIVGDDQLARCLVTEHIDGKSLRSPASWNRMGRTLQRLEGVPWRGSGLTILDESQFVLAHQDRTNALGDRLASAPRCGPTLLGPLIITHGDPGDGNYLESDTRAVLIDWEQAQVAPRGVDLARATFIALLRAAHSDFGDKENARAVIAGYLIDSDWNPTISELKWWLEVAGVQVVHNRWLRSDEPNVPSWQDAAIVLEDSLSDDYWLIHG